MPEPALLLFDLDGTLLDTGGVGQRVMRAIGEEHFDGRLDFDAVQFGGLLDPLIFAQAAAAGGLEAADAQHERFRELYVQALAVELSDHNPEVVLPGVFDLLDQIDSVTHATTGLLTGNYQQAGPIKLKHGGIDARRFAITVFGDEAPTRPDMVARAIERYRGLSGHAPKPERVIVVGDTPRDIDCAHAHGCHAFAVATGRFTVHQLQQAGADSVVADLSDPAPLSALIA